MKTYTLKLKTTSTVDYNLYDGTTLVSDTDLVALFGSAGEAYFVFDFNSLTPTSTTALNILDSNSATVIANTGLTGIVENKNFKGTWSASATAFDTFVALTGVAMDEAQLGKLASLAKNAGPTVVQTAGTSQTDVMSQNAATSMIYPKSSNGVVDDTTINIGGTVGDNNYIINIGKGSYARQLYCTTVGARGADAKNTFCTAIGSFSIAGAPTSAGASALGYRAEATGRGSVALGIYSSASSQGQFDVGTSDATYGYNSSNYRLLTGLYDGQSAHDAVNLGQLQNAIINGGTSAPTTTTVGAVGTQYTYVDTTGTPTAHLCVCTEIDTTDPSNPVYTWSTLI